MENIQVVKLGNILKEKSGWPVTLPFSAKRYGSNGHKILKVMNMFSNLVASQLSFMYKSS